MRKLRSREGRARVRYPEGPNTELQSGPLAHPGGYSCPFCIVQVSPNPFLYPKLHHITMDRGFWAHVPCYTGQSLHRTGENFRLEDRLQIDKLAFPFFGGGENMKTQLTFTP